jgi:hypothetical protein
VNKTVRAGTIIAVLVPIALAIVFVWLVSQQAERKNAAEAEANRLRTNNSAIKTLIQQSQVQLIADKTIASESTPDEQAAFLTQLRVNATASGVKLVRYTNRGLVAPPPPPGGQPAPAQIFKPVASSVEIQGPFEGVRAFAYSLLRANRLMNMSAVVWKRNPNDGNTTLSFTLVRYVTDPMPASRTVASAGVPGEAAQ